MKTLYLSLIPVLVPVAIALLKALFAKLPSRWLPVLAPIIGGVIEGAMAVSGLVDNTSGIGVVLGAAGVGLRELLDQLRKPNIPPGAAALLLALLVLIPGCSVIRVSNDKVTGEATRVTCYVPAWPWQDSTKSIEKLTVYSRTNYFSSSLSGLDESQQTSSNAVGLIQAVTAGAVSGAVRAVTGKP
jgi:hypothetical protein